MAEKTEDQIAAEKVNLDNLKAKFKNHLAELKAATEAKVGIHTGRYPTEEHKTKQVARIKSFCAQALAAILEIDPDFKPED